MHKKLKMQIWVDKHDKAFSACLHCNAWLSTQLIKANPASLFSKNKTFPPQQTTLWVKIYQTRNNITYRLDTIPKWKQHNKRFLEHFQFRGPWTKLGIAQLLDFGIAEVAV